ncbi:Protein MAIN-LIKE 2 [Glycine max]|nr:Protein MAIN-LIKE 2 [Glycine max]
MWCLRLKTKVLPWRRTFFRACESGLLVFERKKVFFRGIQRKKVLQVLPRDPAEERCLPQMPAPSRGRTCGTFFRRLPLLLVEEPAEPYSAGYLSFSRKNLQSLLPRTITRGLGRALGTGRGRGISEDVHHADVPRRCMPTASARRQRVHVREDVTERPEDVPQLHEDVPHVSDATPEMTGAVDVVHTEGVTTDGSLGSPAADEGFPGGPRDPSERPDLKLVSHGRKVDKIGRPAPEIEGMIAATGLSPLIRCSVITTDPGLIFAFVERWHRETSTFHLPVGELTITLDDVASLLHVPITGALHKFEPLITSYAIGLLTKLLKAGRPHVRLGWLWDVYESQCRARRWVVAARTYLLHLVGCTLFANKSSTHVHVVHLEAFKDLA